jgi:hypothetical protein
MPRLNPVQKLARAALRLPLAAAQLLQSSAQQRARVALAVAAAL